MQREQNYDHINNKLIHALDIWTRKSHMNIFRRNFQLDQIYLCEHVKLYEYIILKLIYAMLITLFSV
jgi:hypothetical protein